MRLPHLIFLSVLITASESCSRPAHDGGSDSPMSDAGMQAIYDAGDRRAVEELLPYADSDRPAYRMAFARMMGSVQDTAALPALEKLLTDPIPYVRFHAAFAVGQTGRTSSLPALEKALKKATIPEIKAEILEAVGKCADPTAMEFLIHHDPNTTEEEIGKMYGVFRAALKGLLMQDHMRIVEAHLKSGTPDTRYIAALIFARQHVFEPPCEALSEMAFNDADGEVRHAAMQALTGCAGLGKDLVHAAENDNDPRVRSAALANLPTDGSVEGVEDLFVRAMEDGSAWVAMQAAAQYASLPAPALSPTVETLARRTEIPEVRAAIAAQYLHAGEEGVFGDLWENTQWGISRSVVLSALSQIPAAKNLLFEATGWDSPEGSAATEAWIRSAETYPDRRGTLDSMARVAFEGVHPAKASLFARAMRNSVLEPSIDLGDSILHAALNRYGNEPRYAEPISEILKTLDHRSGRELQAFAPTHNNPTNWNTVASWPETPLATLYTGKGNLEMELYVEDAPATVAQFIRLAREGWYDGVAFHRVVPGFVTQGGDPRGDGYGSAPETIRSEFSPLRYLTGSVGMASAGKDTESAQFFIAHCPLPRLDGRYTLFGQVVKGMVHLDAISTATVIDSVRISGIP